MGIFKSGVKETLEDDDCSCDWRLDTEKKAWSSGLVCIFRLTALPSVCPTVFPRNRNREKEEGEKLMKKVFHVGVVIYFVMPVLITVEKPPIMNLNAKEKVYVSLCVCVKYISHFSVPDSRPMTLVTSSTL